MNWLKKTNTDGTVQLNKSAIVEIEASKTASKKAFKEAKQVSKSLNNLLQVENGFTLRIYLATGGENKHKKYKGTK